MTGLGTCEDCLCATCCAPCALCQQHRELQLMGLPLAWRILTMALIWKSWQIVHLPFNLQVRENVAHLIADLLEADAFQPAQRSKLRIADPLRRRH